MIALELPEPFMWALRWILFLGSLALAGMAIYLTPPDRRTQIGALFAFLYGLGMVFATHQVALWFGWWHYGWDVLMLAGLPADIMIGGAILFGPALFLVFPRIGPLWLCLPIIMGLHGTVFSSLRPLVEAGEGWFLGVVFVFATAHIPAIYLAHWTARDQHLPRRVALLAIMFGANAFLILPSLIMLAMGGDWALDTKPIWAWALFLPGFGIACLIGLAAAQTLALQGLGTAIPLDPTRRLVCSGIYAFVCNPMQLSASLGWLLLGALLGNIWVAMAAGMAWVFVLGMVRWHHRHDLMKRFPARLPEYRANVPEWLPRWRPWVKLRAKLQLNRAFKSHRFCARVLKNSSGLDLAWIDTSSARYENQADAVPFTGSEAIAIALTHLNFATALAGHAWLLLSQALRYWRKSVLMRPI